VAAVLAVHQMGMPCNLKEILEIAKEYNLPVVEDAACAIGSEISLDNGKIWERIGKPHGDIACFSFHPRKILTAGEGGMITSKNSEHDKKLRLLRHQGMSVSDAERHKAKTIISESYDVIGYNYRMTDIQAAIGLEQLKKIDAIIQRRRQLADIYSEELKEIPWLKGPADLDYCRSNWQSFPVRVLENSPLARNELMQKLLDEGFSTRFGIMNAHQEKPYKDLGFSLKNSEDARDSVILFPLFHELTTENIKQIIKVLKDV